MLTGGIFFSLPFLPKKAMAQKGENGEESAVKGSPHRLNPGDVVKIMVQKDEECTGEFVVNDKGFIQFCYVGDVLAKGKTQKGFQKEIISILEKDYLHDPKVNLNIKKYGIPSLDEGWVNDSIRIIGEVNGPGIYKLKIGYTVLDAILDAGGLTEYASPNRTKIVRGKGKEKKVIVIKLKVLMKTGDRAKDTFLKAGDTILIPESII